MLDNVVLPLLPNLPRSRAPAFIRWIARLLLRLAGWRMRGTFPDLPRVVVIAAPHSSNWDGLWGLCAILAMGLDMRVLGKHQLFWWPLGPILRAIGVIAINRGQSQGVADQVAAMICGHERMWVGLAPEGTRKRVEHWKPGFWKIAKAAAVPVLPVYFHYPEKIMGVGEPFELSDDMDADIARIKSWYAPWQGKNHGV